MSQALQAKSRRLRSQWLWGLIAPQFAFLTLVHSLSPSIQQGLAHRNLPRSAADKVIAPSLLRFRCQLRQFYLFLSSLF